MKIPIESTAHNFNAASKILNIKDYSFVKEERTIEAINLIVAWVIIGIDIIWGLRNTPYLCVRIQVYEARAFYYNESIGVVFKGLIHE